jgi:7-carboxy-7-deazaguanine synthase
MNNKMQLENISHLRKEDQLKFIIRDKEDYNYAKKIIKTHDPDCTIYFQPVWETNPKKIAEWILYDNLNVRLGLQLHKILWSDKRGV